MEKQICRISAAVMAILSLIVSIAVLRVSQVNAGAEKEGNQIMELEYDKISGMELMDYYTAKAESTEEELEHQMRIELPSGISSEEVIVENDYIHRRISITIPGINQEYYYAHPLLGSSSHIDDLKIGSDDGLGIIEISLDEVYEVEKTVKDSWLYLDFIPPQDLYDKVIVVDAGHGNTEPGAIKQGIMEKDLNLAIVLALKELLDSHENWKVYYTRTDDAGPTLDERVQLANRSHANLFISVHNNSTRDGKMSDYHGTEVMYDESKDEESTGDMESFGSKELAQVCLEELVGVTGSRDLGLARGHSIYIIRTSQVPVALIEAGFMTSREELEKLGSQDYQKQVALGIYNGIVRALEEGF